MEENFDTKKRELDFLDCIQEVSSKLHQIENVKYTNRYGEKNLLSHKCSKRYERWLNSYSSFLLDSCNEGEADDQFCLRMSDQFLSKKANYRNMIQDNFNYATDCEDKQFIALLKRVDEGTTIKEVSCPFKSMGGKSPH
jgi:hypothetical protein